MSHARTYGVPSREVASILPRFIRLRDAPTYLGMDKNRFNREVRPLVAVIPIGAQGIAFDRLDLDSWADDYKSRNGHPAAQPERGIRPQEAHQGRRAAAEAARSIYWRLGAETGAHGQLAGLHREAEAGWRQDKDSEH